MAGRSKYYVVWEGRAPGIYDSWEECQMMTEGFPGARFKAFPDQDSATRAFRGKPEDHIGILKSIAQHAPVVTNYDAFPEINQDAIAVDAACSRNPGPVEYRGVDVRTGATIFHVGPFEEGTNNIGEYLGLIHALAMLDKEGNHTRPIYTDSRTALSWIKRRGANTKLTPTPGNEPLRRVLARADAWIQSHTPQNPIMKWNTEEWGEIPADFGRK
ncbi:MAG: ribonuclease H family protein [Muribaculaceae bacterium]|nr:ribonuclease H family protein [Muribaculaceae bacterium]